MADQERKRLLAFGKAHVLEPTPLITSYRYEHEPSENMAPGCHRGVEQTGLLKSPLDQGCEQGESGPHEEIADGEPHSSSEWCALRPGLPAHADIHKNHWGRR